MTAYTLIIELLKVNQDGQTTVLISNRINSPGLLEHGRDIAHASEVDVEIWMNHQYIEETTEGFTSINTSINSSNRLDDKSSTEVTTS